MQKVIKKMLLLVALLAPMVTNAQSASTLTVADGTSSNGYLPIYGFYMDAAQRTQVIYYDSLLTDMRGNYIHSLTYYSTGTVALSYTSTMTISMGITESNTLTTTFDNTELTAVWTGQISMDGSQLIIELDSVFEYPSDGGNLLIQFQQTSGGNYSSRSYYGVSSNGNGLRQYGSTAAALENFMPKLTFTYSESSISCLAPNTVMASGTSANAGLVRWIPRGDADTWNVFVSDSIITDFENVTYSTVTDTFYNVYGLNASTTYYAYVQSDCGTGIASAWVGPYTFLTACDGTALPVPQMYDFDNVAHGELPQCWTAVMTGTSGSGTFPMVYEYEYNARSGSSYLEFESTSGQEEILRMATYDASDPIMLRFYGTAWGSSYAPQLFVVGYYGSDDEFVPYDTITLGTAQAYPNNPIEVMFTDVTLDEFAPAIRVVGNGSSQYTVFIDDLSVMTIPDCRPPIQFHALNVGGTQLDLQWNDTTTATSWTVVYDTVPIEDMTTPAYTQSFTTDSVTIDNLTNNTVYYFYLQSDCPGGGTSEWVGPLVVATNACDDGCYYHVAMVDGYGDGWNGGYLQYSLNGVMQDYTITLLTGDAGTDSLYVCPGMNIQFFFVAGSFADEVEFTLQNAFDEALYTCNDGSTLSSTTACYSSVASCTSACPSPNQLMVTAYNPTSLDISWNERGDATQWNIICSTTPVTDFSNQTIMVANNTTYTITGLDSLTNYYIYVQADCGSDSSIWVMIQARTSLCEGACELIVDCVSTYDYGDSWSYGYSTITVTQGGQTVGSLMSTGTVQACPNDTITFQYSSTDSYYDTYNTWTVYDSYANPLTNTIVNQSAPVSIVTDCQAPTCPRPLQFAFAGTSSGTQSLTWTEMGEATSWNVAYGTEPMSDTTTLTVINVTDTTFVTITGLSDDSIYYYYVQADCGGDMSEWTGPISGRPNIYIMTNTTTSIYACGGHIYDDGGPNGNYSNYMDAYLTVYPSDSTMGVAITGTQWTESGSWDWLTIYNGVGNSGTVLFTSQGADASYNNGLAVSVASISGPLTIYFHTDGSGTYPGFDLAVSCFDMTCPAIDSLTVNSVTDNAITLSWVGDDDALGYRVKWATSPFTFESTAVDSMDVTTTGATLSNLTSNTMYYIAIATNCGSSISNPMTLNVRTACGTMTLPYFDDFESYAYGTSNFPSCWYSNYGTNYVQSSSTYASSGSQAIHMQGPGIILSPRVPLPGNQIQLSVSLRAESTTSSGSMHIGFTTDPINMSDYVEIQNIQPVTNHVLYSEIIFSNAGTDTGYVVFKQDPNASTAWYWWVDDVTIEAIPACPGVGNVTATNIDTNSISLSWVERGNATQWTVEYGVHGFTAGTGTLTTVSDTNFTATGLTPGTEYDFIIKPVCVDSIPDHVFTFSTYTVPISVPFFFDFSDPNQSTSWSRENGSNGWFIGALDGDTVLYISSDNGSTNGYNGSSASISYAYVDLILPANEYTFSYNWRANGESSFDFLRVALVPQNVSLVGSGSYADVTYGSLPAGWIALDNGDRLNQQSNWQSYAGDVVVPNAGGYHLAFIWRNDPSVGNNPAAAIDDIYFAANTCPTVANIHAASAGTTEIEVDWTDNAESQLGYIIEYGPMGFNRGTGTILTTTTHPVTVSNLDTLTNYDFYVRVVCSSSDTSRWSNPVTLSTGICDGQTEVSTGSASGTTYTMPVCTYYNYTLTETLISADELEGISEINAISYLYNHTSSPDTKTDVTIWLQPTGKTAFANTSDMVTLDTNIAVQVWSGSFANVVYGWNTFSFDNPFTWTGDSASLMVIVDDNSGDYNSSSHVFATVNDTANRSITYYDDSDNPNPLDPASYDGYNSYIYMARPAMKLIACSGSSCRKPSGLNATNVTYNSATLHWGANGENYEVAVKASTTGVWPEGTPVTVTSGNATYQLTGLNAATEYQYRVRQVCDAANGEYSDWVTNSLTTVELPCFAPEDYTVTSTTMSEATISWPEATNATAYEIHVWNSVDNLNFEVTGTPATITGLAQTTTYNLAIRSVCGYGAEMSEYGDTITFTTQTCPVPGNPTASNVTATSAVISWTGDAESYVIEYGQGAFGEGQGIATVEVNGTTYTINGLNPETQYSALVRAKCDNVNLSGWSNRAVFTTETEGIDAVDGLNVNIYPNPTSGNTTITLSGVNGMVNIAIVDLNGRTVRSETMSCEGDCAHQLEVSGLASGAYFVRISGDGVNSVKKLIVK